MEPKKVRSITPFNRVLYVLFILLAVYQIFVKKDYIDATASLGIGLIFDPFNPNQPWQERPMWQKVWLFVHLAIVALVFGLGVGLGDR
ncbi:hypothetical protein ACSVH2_11490 [Flavobacterium sp. RSB2_4_14]|uniref:hypothetical protein n=1 Tax=Flavobacterium sp. RSB2_4_14 TaxID=3447665 RepID=UPI003F3BF0F4